MREANRILVIDNRDSFVYNIVEYLRRIGGTEVAVVREGAESGLFPEDYLSDNALPGGVFQANAFPDDIAGIVLSPGAGIPHEYPLMTAVLENPRTAAIPVLGVCLGMQAMAVATGGRLRQLSGPKHGHRSGLYFAKRQDCSEAAWHGKDTHSGTAMHSGESLYFGNTLPVLPGILDGIPDGSPIGRYHSWVVDEASLPECWDIAGRDEDGNIMLIVHRSRPWTGVQFHPESIITEYGFRMICNWVNGCSRV